MDKATVTPFPGIHNSQIPIATVFGLFGNFSAKEEPIAEAIRSLTGKALPYFGVQKSSTTIVGYVTKFVSKA
jgi:hypothetical protein